MKTAIYIEDGVTQLVITPESKFEKEAVEGISKCVSDARVMSGSFYDCRGGWVRQADHFEDYLGGSSSGDQSLIIRMDEGERK